MNELWLRVAVVAGALAVAGIVALITRRRVTAGVHTVRTRDLDPGLYFFSSASCSSCEQARAKLESRLGVNGYKEFAWERHPEMFTEHGIDRVPAVMVVAEDGRGRVHLGQPDRVLGP